MRDRPSNIETQAAIKGASAGLRSAPNEFVVATGVIAGLKFQILEELTSRPFESFALHRHNELLVLIVGEHIR